LIDAFLLSKPTPTIGAPPTDTPGEPKALLLPPVVCGEFRLFVPLAPVGLVPPIPVDEPKLLPVLELVPPMGELDDPLLPNGELDDPEPNDEPLLPNPDPEEPRVGLALLGEDPEAPKGEEDPPKGDEEDAAFVLAPVGVMPFCCTVWPNKPMF